MKNNKIILHIILFVGAFDFFDLPAMQGEQGVSRISQVNQSITNASSENNKVNINEHPLMFNEELCLLDSIANKASQLIDANFSGKKQIIVGLGQSPAYLLEMIKLLDAKNGRCDRFYLNVAFSGSYYVTGEFYDGSISSFVFEQYQKYKNNYLSYLNKIGLSVEALNDAETKFIILEFCCDGKGLTSFLSFFSEYREKPSVVYIQDQYSATIFHSIAPWQEELVLESNEYILIDRLANADRFNDRLVPYFSWKEWALVDPLLFKQHENALTLKKSLQNFVDSKYLSA